jgi:hypothetical protein
MTLKNNVTRLLDSRKIAYQVFEFSEEKHSATSAPDSAAQICASTLRI